MKLYEFSSLVTVHTVIAAENEGIARKRLSEFTAEALVNGCGDVLDVADIDLFDVRNPKSEDLEDLINDAHDIVSPKENLENAVENPATNAGCHLKSETDNHA